MKAAVFDMDGTLIDSMPGLTDLAVENINAFFGLNKTLARTEYLRTVGLPYREQLEKIFPNMEHAVNAAVEAYSRQKRQVTLEAPVFPIMRAILRAVPEMGGVTCLISSTDCDLVAEVVEKHFRGMFTCIAGYKPGYRKPDQLQDFLASQGIRRKDRTFYYGDTKEDARIAFLYDLQFIKVEGCLTFLQ